MNDETPDEQDLPSDSGSIEREPDEEFFESEFDILMRERDEAIAARQRALADFANFQRRATENESRARREGISRVVRMLFPVVDQFELALAQDTDKVTAEQIILGVEMVRMELDKAVEECGVKKIKVEPGDPFNPGQHEAMLRLPSEDVPPGHVVQVLKHGYIFGEMVLRPAQVAVSPESDD